MLKTTEDSMQMFDMFRFVEQDGLKVCINQNSQTFFDARFVSSQGSIINLHLDTLCLGYKFNTITKMTCYYPNINNLETAPLSVKGHHFLGRLKFENEEVKIIFDQLPDKANIEKNLKSCGGYQINSKVILEYKKAVQYSKIRDEVNCLNHFISFINGRWTAAPFIQLQNSKGTNSLLEINTVKVQNYIKNKTWIADSSRPDLSILWSNFRKAWKDEYSRDIMKKTIHWYTEVTIEAGQVEGSIIMAQACLEMLSNYWLGEKKGILFSHDLERISAAGKMRILLNLLDIDINIPDHLKSLKGYIEYFNRKNIKSDGPLLITEYRNLLIHFTNTKKDKIKDLEILGQFKILQLAIYYIEMSLLKILGYSGPINNRLFVGSESLQNI
ncbi:MAG: hypothetical protein RLZZ546_2647, partial [Bacteroidota bacterium]|jgi:hypothetical protein